MKKKFYHEERSYRIFALYDDIAEKRAYIGKTISSRMTSVYSWHRRGHNRYTRELFEIDFLDPEMVVLEEVICTGSAAYRYVLAWIRFFGEQGFEILNPGSMLEQSLQMQEETLKIYEQITEMPVEAYLSTR